jgi:outer membrane protein TolC
MDGALNVADTIVYAQMKQRIANQNIDLRMGMVDQNIVRQEVRELKQEQWPTLSLNSGYNYNRSSSEAGFLLSNRVNGWSYGLTVRWNLFDGWNQQRMIENAEIRQDISRLEYENTNQEVMGNFEVAYQRYIMALRKLKLEEENTEVAAENIQLAQDRFELGNLSGIEYREIQQQYYDAQTRHLDAQYQALVFQLELKRLSGEILQR